MPAIRGLITPETTPPSIPTTFRTAPSYLGKGDYDRAIADYNQVIKLNPKNHSAINARVTCSIITIVRPSRW